MPTPQEFYAILPNLPPVINSNYLINAVMHVGFTMHLLFVNILVGWAVMALFYTFFNTNKNPNHRAFEPAQLLVPLLPKTLAFVVNFAIVPFILLQLLLGSLVYPVAGIMGFYWLAIALVVMFAYYSLYITLAYKKNTTKRTTFLLLATVLLSYTGFLFSSFVNTLQNPASWSVYTIAVSLPAQGYLLNTNSITFVARLVHIFVSCLAIGGLAFAVYSAKNLTALAKQHAPAEIIFPHARNTKIGLNWYVCATLSQFIVGSWFLMTLPDTIKPNFMGQHILATSILAFSIATSIASLITAMTNRVFATAGLCLLSVISMIALREFLRTFLLENMPKQALLGTADTSTTYFFAALSIFSIAVWYMLRLHNKVQSQTNSNTYTFENIFMPKKMEEIMEGEKLPTEPLNKRISPKKENL